MKIHSSARSSWIIEVNGNRHQITATYDEQGNYITGTLAKTFFEIDGVTLHKNEERIKGASHLSEQISVPLNNGSENYQIRADIESYDTHETKSVHFELTKNGSVIPYKENFSSIQPKAHWIFQFFMTLVWLSIIPIIVYFVSGGNLQLVGVVAGVLILLVIIGQISQNTKEMSPEEKKAAGTAAFGILAILGAIAAVFAASKYSENQQEQERHKQANANLARQRQQVQTKQAPRPQPTYRPPAQPSVPPSRGMSKKEIDDKLKKMPDSEW